MIQSKHNSITLSYCLNQYLENCSSLRANFILLMIHPSLPSNEITQWRHVVVPHVDLIDDFIIFDVEVTKHDNFNTFISELVDDFTDFCICIDDVLVGCIIITRQRRICPNNNSNNFQPWIVNYAEYDVVERIRRFTNYDVILQRRLEPYSHPLNTVLPEGIIKWVDR